MTNLTPTTISSDIRCARFAIRWPVLVSAILASWRIAKLIVTNFSNIHSKEVQFPWTFLIRTHDSPRMNIFIWSTFQNVFAPNFSYAQTNIILNIGEIQPNLDSNYDPKFNDGLAKFHIYATKVCASLINTLFPFIHS